jgi:hypothetical protein
MGVFSVTAQHSPVGCRAHVQVRCRSPFCPKGRSSKFLQDGGKYLQISMASLPWTLRSYILDILWLCYKCMITLLKNRRTRILVSLLFQFRGLLFMFDVPMNIFLKQAMGNSAVQFVFVIWTKCMEQNVIASVLSFVTVQPISLKICTCGST